MSGYFLRGTSLLEVPENATVTTWSKKIYNIASCAADYSFPLPEIVWKYSENKSVITGLRLLKNRFLSNLILQFFRKFDKNRKT